MPWPPEKTESSSSFSYSPDLERDVYCQFGLPVDNCSLSSTKKLLRARIKQGRQTVLSTINVNWVIQALHDPAFRRTILKSDLVVLDGKLLLWLAQLCGCPMRETVPGSTLIQELLEEPCEQQLTIFLFGGDGDTAQQAMQRINKNQTSGLRAVGALNPGFGTVAQMSSDHIIDEINATQPDILLVALGALKGTQWIESNRHRLNAKVISHLGATINFLAGTVQRAPRPLQNFGFEWAWRILQEPKLFTRYAKDGLALLRFILPRLLTWYRFRVKAQQMRQQPDDHIKVQTDLDFLMLRLPAVLQTAQALELRQILMRHEPASRRIVLDFSQTIFMDAAFCGTLTLLQSLSGSSRFKIVTINAPKTVSPWERLFHISLNRGNGARP